MRSKMWPDNINCIDGFALKSSPEPYCDNFFYADHLESTSDEDFITQLSSELDIPLLLNPGEDEMALLNSFFDNKPNEIISDMSSPDGRELSFLSEIQDISGSNDCKFSTSGDSLTSLSPSSLSSSSVKENSRNTYLNESKGIAYFEYLNGALNPLSTPDCSEIKSEEPSDESCSSRNSLEPSTPPPVLLNKEKNLPTFFNVDTLSGKEMNYEVGSTTVQDKQKNGKSMKFSVKRVPIKPKAPYTVPVKSSNIVLINNVKNQFENMHTNNNNIALEAKNISPNIVVLDSYSVNSFNTLTPSLATTINNNINKLVMMPSVSTNSKNNGGIDMRTLKRQERRIKNRESASISRKKKKDYLNSLEEQVKNLRDENRQLTEENASLRNRLSFYEHDVKSTFNVSPRGAKPALVLCAFLLVVGMNLNFTSNPFVLKTNKVDFMESTLPKLPERSGRNLLWALDDSQSEQLNNNTYFSPLSMCPASVNQTESARLVLELEKWIGKPETKNLTAHLQSSDTILKAKRKKIRLDSSLAEFRKRGRYSTDYDSTNEIQVFNPKGEQLFSEFFEAINRQDDTFYVVSFSEQHMLLPALYHNKTRRPKMSLLMPSVFPNETSTQTYIPLMQIDCEVLDTKLVNVKYGSIPRPYRYYGNFTKRDARSESSSNNVTSSQKHNSRKLYKPYFLNKNLLKPVGVE